MANLIDQIVQYVAPGAAIKRAQARRVLAYYEAAKPDRLRKGRRETASGNDAVQRAGASLRQQARHLEQNYDIALGALNILVTNTVGATGIGVEPQPRRADGSIDIELSRQILALYKNWSLKPEVTWLHDWPSAQRMLARAWFRDGEVFCQTVEGQAPFIDHGTTVPFSIEMLEADFVPMELQAASPMIQQGIEINTWGRPVAFHVFKANPIESGPLVGALAGKGQTKRLPADRMLHVATRHRIRQLRGVSVFASVLNRFDDLKDYEESERIAAKIAASMAAFIKKGQPDMYVPPDNDAPAESLRNMKFRAGMIFDDLKIGEEIGTIDTNRPNPNLETYRSGQIKAISAGTGPTYSSLSRTYDGTYSAQRQELVEGWVAYQVLSAEFISRIVRPVYEKFIALAVLSGALRVPAGIDRASLDDAIYVPPQMPWIDPKKEAEAWAMLEDRAYISGPEIIRKRGGNPVDVLDQQQRWMQEKDDRGIPHDAGKGGQGSPDSPGNPPPGNPPDPDDDDDSKGSAASQIAAALSAPLAALAGGMTALASRDPKIEFRAGDVLVEAPQIHNHLPEQLAPEMHAHFEATLPEQPAPQVSVTNQVQVPEQPAPVVRNEVVVQPAEVKDVRIVGMPDRVTTTTVDRDGAGNLKTSTQTEKDA